MRIRLEVKEGEGRKKVIEGFGPPSRFNTIGRSHIYIRLFSGRIPADGIKPERSSKQPEILFHSGKEGSIERASVVFGGKVYHYDVIPENVLKGDAYRIFKALEALMKGNKEPLKKLAREWRGET
ncbi:MAG: hypothetical protein PWQ11_696, partial [Candidatus Diapherotrites archaeon]|nr:hypothetical protein [Candidatus Diapherotrites archaeon]